MISYQRKLTDHPGAYASGFKVADTDDVQRIARCIQRCVWSPSIFKDGRRIETHFLKSDWIALDFDSPEMSLEQAVKSFCDAVHIIGTTKSHQKVKNNLVCDRFRVLLKMTSTVSNLADYRHTVATVVNRYPCDPNPKDGARFFWPCQDIVSVSGEGFTEDPLIAPPSLEESKCFNDCYRFQRFGVMPSWLADFLAHGKLVRSAGRNSSVYAAAIALSQLGIPQAEAVRLISASPFDRKDFSDQELRRTITSGYGGRHGRSSTIPEGSEEDSGRAPGGDCQRDQLRRPPVRG